MEIFCPWEPAKHFIFSSNVPTLLYYSHFVAILAALVFAALLFHKRQDLSIRFFLNVVFLFISWAVIDVLLWASNRPDLVLFYWSLQILCEVLIYGVSFYFAYVFIKRKDLPFSKKLFLMAVLLPVAIILPTKGFLPGIDVSYCDAVESNLVIFYTYGLEILLSFSVLFVGFGQMAIEIRRRKEIGLFLAGIIVFLFAFSSGNIIGSLTENWVIAQVGLLGMPLFIAFLVYLVVKFKAFNIKLISTQAIVVTLWLLTFSILFVRNIQNVRYVVFVTLALFSILGYQLIRSVKREIKSREEIEILAENLKKTNTSLEHANTRLKELDVQKTEFVSFATHQLRSPLTAMKGYSSLILEGDYGDVAPDVRDAVQKIYESTNTLTNVVNDYLNISRIELGTMKYDMRPLDLKDMVREVAGELKPNIDKAGLDLTIQLDERQKFVVNADLDKFKQVVANLIDNSVKYTPQGSITVSLTKDPAKGVVLFAVKDTGIGMSAEIIPKLFAKFKRAENANKVNIRGTGLGLYVAKEIVKAHNGRVWAESEGEGRGSQFYVELPIAG